jgi:hypothetical protein
MIFLEKAQPIQSMVHDKKYHNLSNTYSIHMNYGQRWQFLKKTKVLISGLCHL